MPELAHVRRGDELSLSQFPSLKHIVQTGFQSMNGVNKFTESIFYAIPGQTTNLSLAPNEPNAEAFIAYSHGQQVSSFTSNDLVNQSEKIYNNHLVNAGGKPIFCTLDLSTPLGLACFLGSSTNNLKMFVPGSYNMSQMLKSVRRQHTNYVICDNEFYNLQVPEGHDYIEMCSEVNNVLVGGSQTGESSMLLGDAKASFINPLTL